MKEPVDWICEVSCIAVKTVLVSARSRKEALEILRTTNGPRVGIDVSYGSERARRVICRDGKEAHP